MLTKDEVWAHAGACPQPYCPQPLAPAGLSRERSSQNKNCYKSNMTYLYRERAILKKGKKKKIIQDSDIILSLLNLTTLLSVWYFFSQHPVRKEKIIGNWYLESLISLRVIFKQPKSHPHTHAVFSVSWLQFSQVPSPKESEHGCFWPRSHRQSGAEHSTLTTELSFLTSL